MAFFGYEFIFNGINSSTFGLFISNLDSSGLINSPMGSGVNPITKKLLRNPQEYIYGIEQSPVLEFNLEFNSANPLSGVERDAISSWLFGQTQYRTLQIIQDDLQDFSFNCIITEATASYIGNLHYGWKCHVRCDSPFAYDATKYHIHSSGSAMINETISIFNVSSNNDYTYPLVTFTTNGVGTSFSLTNASDNNRQFSFSGISAGETITVDNDKKIIQSSTGLMRISKFNYNWFRLVPGVNTVTAVGGVNSYIISYVPYKKIGG